MKTLTPLPEIDATPIRSTAYSNANERWDEIVYKYIDSIYTFSMAVNETLIPELETWRSTIDGAFDYAKSYADNAQTYANQAKSYASDASTSATNASTSATNAASSATSASGYATNAKTYQDNAKKYQDNASASATNAKTSETNAASSASSAATSASNAKTYQDNAKSYYDDLVNVTLADYVTATTFSDTLASYLPLSGGTLTGTTIFPARTIFRASNTIQQILSFQNTSKGTNPSSALWSQIDWTDNDTGGGTKHRYAAFECGVATTGQTDLYLRAYDNTVNSNLQGCIAIHYPKGGTPYTEAPTPATTDNSTKIATTAFVKNQGYLIEHQSLSNYVTATTFSDTLASYLPLSGGTITGNIILDPKLIKFRGYDTTEAATVRTDSFFNVISCNAGYGLNVSFGSRSSTVIFAGECGPLQLAELEGSSAENVYLAADNGISFKVGANTYANAKLVRLDNNANLSGLNTVTATTFSGTATQATQDGSGNNIVNTYATKTELNARWNMAAYSSGTYDLNDFTSQGTYYFSGTTTLSNVPEGGGGTNGYLIIFATAASVVRQMWFRHGTNDSNEHMIYTRQGLNGSWSTWKLIITDTALTNLGYITESQMLAKLKALGLTS